MTLSCPSCQLEVRIDTSRLTPGRTHQAACPRCKAVFPVTGGPASAPPKLDVAVVPPPSAVGDPRAEAWLQRELEKLRMQIKEEVLRDVLREVLPEGATSRSAHVGHDTMAARAHAFEALVIADDGPARQATCAALTQLGYRVDIASDLRAAATFLAKGQHAVAVVERGLAGDEQAGSKVLAALNGLPGRRRRELFVAYVSADTATMDPGSAFAHGVNMTVNRADAQSFGELLTAGLSERDEMYRIYREVSGMGEGN